MALSSLSGSGELVVFVDSARYDESTFTINVAQPPDVDASEAIAPEVATRLHETLRQALEDEVVVERSPAKLFQTENFWAALIAMPGVEGAATTYHFIASEPIASVQILQRTTAHLCVCASLSTWVAAELRRRK